MCILLRSLIINNFGVVILVVLWLIFRQQFHLQYHQVDHSLTTRSMLELFDYILIEGDAYQ
jgi:hypothetical protein